MTKIQRTFIPGDEWVFFKLYTGYKTADAVLSNTFPGLIAPLYAEDLIDKWFFIRYADPHSHLRVRFHLKSPDQLPNLFLAFKDALFPYLESELIWKVQVDTYNRELERYGTKTIDDAETIFCIDSEAIIEILKILKDYESDDQRWLVALQMINSLLDDFEFDPDKKKTLLTRISADFKKEFGFTEKGYRLQLDKKYRANKKMVEEVMFMPEKVVWFIPIMEVIRYRSVKIRPVAKKLLNLNQQQLLEVSLEALFRSYIHMTLNRLFRSKQRLCELVIYDMLERYYTSVIAREEHLKTQTFKR